MTDNFVERLKELMEDLKVSGRGLAKILNIGYTTVACWVSGNTKPRYDKLIQLAELNHSSIDYMLGLTDNDKLTLSKNPKSFHERFIILSKISGLSDYKIAQACGVAHSSVSRWRHEGTIPDTNALIKLAEFFDCSVEYLLGRTD